MAFCKSDMSLSILFCITYLLLRANASFTYPTAADVFDFHVGDTIEVAWESTYSTPTLKLFCGNRETRK